jgi:predicted HTH transcriptional regulator
MTTGQDLRGMVQTELVEQTGFGRWTKYILQVKDVSINNSVRNSDEDKILSYIMKHGSISNSECRELLDVKDARAYYLLKKLSKKGKLKALKKGKGRRYVVS